MKLNIARRVMLLVLSGSLLTFFVMSVLSLYGMFNINLTLNTKEYELGETAADYVKDYAAGQIQERLMEIARGKADLMSHEFSVVAKDTEYLAGKATHLLKNPEAVNPVILAKPREQMLYSRQPYVHYGVVLDGTINGGISAEIGILSNVAEDLKLLSRNYGACFLGSKHGYIVGIYATVDGGPAQPFSGESLTSFDSRQREWYKLGQHADGYAFTDVYVSTKGYPCVTCVVPYFDNEGFAGVAGVDCNPEEVYRRLTEENAIGTEYSFILGRQGKIIFSSPNNGSINDILRGKDLRQSGDESLAEAARRMTDGEKDVVPVVVNGVEHYLAFAPVGSIGWSYGALLEKDSVLSPVTAAKEAMQGAMVGFRDEMDELFNKIYVGAIVLLIPILLLLILFSVKVSQRFVKPIHNLADGVREIAQGNLDKQLEVRTGDELEHLSACFNAMGHELKDYMKNLEKATAEKERVSTELSLATKIQADMLPRNFREISEKKNFAIFASMQPARAVGGDFYDFYLVDEKHLVVTIADVSGKGIPASLFMMISQTVLKNYTAMMQKPDDISGAMTLANKRLCKNNDGGMFVTAFMGMLDLDTGRFIHSNGGHNPPLVGRLQKDGKRVFEYMQLGKSRVLGILERNKYTQMEISLEPGDMLFLYTDGVTEAMSEENQLYSEERLKDALDRVPAGASVEDVVAFVRDDIRKHVGMAEQSDDITMLTVLYQGSEEEGKDVRE